MSNRPEMNALGWPAPAGVSAAAIDLWRTTGAALIKRGTLESLDRGAFDDYVRVWDRLRQAEEILSRDGLLIDGRRGSLVKHPAAAIVRQYRDSLNRHMESFGLTPKHRRRVKAEEPRRKGGGVLQLIRTNPTAPPEAAG